MHRTLSVVITSVRWWFGLTYVVAGVGACIAGPIQIGQGDYGGVYMIVGGSVMAAVGWVTHPRGFQRTTVRR